MKERNDAEWRLITQIEAEISCERGKKGDQLGSAPTQNRHSAFSSRSARDAVIKVVLALMTWPLPAPSEGPRGSHPPPRVCQKTKFCKFCLLASQGFPRCP